MDKKDISRIVVDKLKEFPLFKDNHVISVDLSLNFEMHIEYMKKKEGNIAGTTYFDIYINENVCYLDKIELESWKRGKGFGRKLYSIIEDIGRNLWCDRIIMTPSGVTFKGESRRDWVMRNLNYLPRGMFDVEKRI